MLAQMFSIKPLPRELRCTFELPEDPYDSNEELSDKACDYLRELGIFFYRDESCIFGIVIQLDDGDTEPITDRIGFFGYKQLVNLHPRRFTPVEWEKPSKEQVAKEGDAKAWLIFNEKRLIYGVTESAVKSG